MSVQLNFEDLPAGTVVTTQYQSHGIIFENAKVAQDPLAPSPGKALYAIRRAGPSEFPYHTIKGTFTNPKHSRIALFAGTGPQNSSVGAELNAFDSKAQRIGSAVPITGSGTSSHWGFGEIVSSAANIASFTVTGLAIIFTGIDNVTFDDPSQPQQPDFRFNPIGGALSVGSPGSTELKIQVARLNGSTGGIDITVADLPPGLTVTSIAPNPFSGGDGSIFTVTIAAGAKATPVQNHTFHITGTPKSASAGNTPHTIGILITVLDRYDVQVVGIEVTQSIQVYDLPKRLNPFSTKPVSYSSGGVFLAEGGYTLVRVFCTIRKEPKNTILPVFNCLLSGTRDSVPLPKSPLSPNSSVPVQPGGDFVTESMRADPNGATVFTLPPEWTHGVITLHAELLPSWTPIPYPNVDFISSNNEFILKDIPFQLTRELHLAPFCMKIDLLESGFTDVPFDVFAEARNLLPIGDDQFYLPYFVGYIDITDIYLQTDGIDDIGRGSLALDRLRNVADDNNFTDSGELVVGIYSGQAGSQIRSQEGKACAGPFWDCDELACAIVQDSNRPLTSVAHEFGHLLGRKHASGAKGASDPEDWPPDQMGFIQGVGIDRRNYSRILFPDRAGGSLGGPFFDFMSYAANDRDSWISIRGWNETLATLNAELLGAQSKFAHPAFTRAVAHEITSEPTAMVIHALVNANGETSITKVAPVTGRKPIAGEKSQYRFLIRDRTSRLLCEIRPIEVTIDIYRAPDTLLLEAVVPLKDWSEVGAVEVYRDQTALVRHIRPTHPPSITAIMVLPCDSDPPSDTPLHTVTWRSQHLDGLPLTAKVDYSMDSETWRTIWFGPDKGIVALPIALFSKATAAQLRVRISDGFNEASALSQPFATPGTPPQVRIVSPRRCGIYRTGCTLYLHGEAFDDTQHPIKGDSLHWFIGDTKIGVGAVASFNRIEQGTQVIRLEARDGHGRVQSETVEVIVHR